VYQVDFNGTCLKKRQDKVSTKTLHPNEDQYVCGTVTSFKKK